MRKNRQKVVEQVQGLVEGAAEPAPVIPETPKAAPTKHVPPSLPIEEFVRSYSNYKPQHLASILAFCHSRGLPRVGTEEELTQVLVMFGWNANLRKPARR